MADNTVAMLVPTMRGKPPKGGSFDEMHIEIAANGYIVTVDDDKPDDVRVFTTFESMSEWIFRNLAKPQFLTTH